MKKEDIIERHWRLWEDQNKQIRRTVAASLVFAVIALFNIIVPYKGLFIEKAEIAEKIETVQNKLNESEASLQELKALDDVMADVAKTLDRRPWDAKRFELIDKYSRLRRHDQGTPDLYQRMADSTVLGISDQVKTSVYEPLAPYLNQQAGINKSAPETLEQATALLATLEFWEKENIGKTWYRTLETKEATINKLSDSLDESLLTLARTLDQERQSLHVDRQQLDAEIKKLQSVNLERKEKELKELQNRMTQILPSWIRGLVSIEQLALYFPHIIAGIMLFVFWIGHSLSMHFAAATSHITDDDLLADPALSSNWTLTRRSSWGTAQSIASYLLYAAAMFIAFEKGISVLRESTIAASLRASTFVFSPLFFWILRFAMIVTLFYVIGQRFLKKTL